MCVPCLVECFWNGVAEGRHALTDHPVIFPSLIGDNPTHYSLVRGLPSDLLRHPPPLPHALGTNVRNDVVPYSTRIHNDFEHGPSRGYELPTDLPLADERDVVALAY